MRPSGLHATLLTIAEWPFNSRRVCPETVSHSRTVLSLLPMAKMRPMQLHATLCNLVDMAFQFPQCLPTPASQTRTMLSSLPVASADVRATCHTCHPARDPERPVGASQCRRVICRQTAKLVRHFLEQVAGLPAQHYLRKTTPPWLMRLMSRSHFNHGTFPGVALRHSGFLRLFVGRARQLGLGPLASVFIRWALSSALRVSHVASHACQPEMTLPLTIASSVTQPQRGHAAAATIELPQAIALGGRAREHRFVTEMAAKVLGKFSCASVTPLAGFVQRPRA